MSRDDRESTARRYVECLAKKDIAGIESIYAADATVEDPIGSKLIVGIDAILEFYRTFAFPPIETAELTGPVRCPANAAAFAFRLTVANDADASVVETIDIIDVFEFDKAGRVTSMKAYWG